jgi:glutamine amidotransferase
MTSSHRDRVVGIVDYKAGNLQSIENAFVTVGATVVRVHSRGEMARCTHLVLPGVGAFGFCAERLEASQLIGDLKRWAFDERRPLLGICVGMQLLADRSEESPAVSGLDWIGGQVRRIPAVSGIRVPHVGWNSVRFQHRYGEFDAGDEADFYFDHSFAYHDPTCGRTVGFCKHGVTFSAIIESENLIAVQFHPEKSQATGLRFINGFLSQ